MPPMIIIILVIAAGIFVVGAAIGAVAVVSLGIHREERELQYARQEWEERFIETGEIPNGYLPATPPGPMTAGARLITGLSVQRPEPTARQVARADLPV